MPKLLPFEEARSRLASAVEPIPGSESCPLFEASGRILAEALRSPMDVPPYPNAAMDGYALRSEDLREGGAWLEVIGTSFAGHPYPGKVAPGTCVRIMTGAVVPHGADTVVMQEEVKREGDKAFVGPDHPPGEHVRLPGEDIRKGEVVLPQGRRLTPADIGLIASLGLPEVKVKRRPRAAFFSTGDELRPLGTPLGPGQIYDSNRYVLRALMERLGMEVLDMGVIPDERHAVEAAFEEASAMADTLITTGGVSVGEADYVKETLERLGKVEFWRIAIKPGKPLAFGKLGKTYFFGLPGNPVSAMVTFLELVQPTLRRLSGEDPAPPLHLKVPALESLKKTPGRMDFQRGILVDENGRLGVKSTGPQGSHMLSSMSQANCLILLPAEWGNVEAGTEVEVEPFFGLFC